MWRVEELKDQLGDSKTEKRPRKPPKKKKNTKKKKKKPFSAHQAGLALRTQQKTKNSRIKKKEKKTDAFVVAKKKEKHNYTSHPRREGGTNGVQRTQMGDRRPFGREKIQETKTRGGGNEGGEGKKVRVIWAGPRTTRKMTRREPGLEYQDSQKRPRPQKKNHPPSTEKEKGQGKKKRRERKRWSGPTVGGPPLVGR